MRLQSAVDRLLAYAFPETRTFVTQYTKHGSIHEGDGHMYFSSENYLRLPYGLKNTDNSEYVFTFTTSSLNYNTQYIAHCEYLFAISIYYNQVRVYNWQNRSITTIFNIEPCKTYNVRINILDKNVTVSYSKDGGLYEQVYSRVDTLLDSTQTYPIILGAHSVSYTDSFSGIIHVSGCYVKISGETLFDSDAVELLDEQENPTDLNYYINTGVYHINSQYALTGFYSTQNFVAFKTRRPETSFDLIVKIHTPKYFNNYTSFVQASEAYKGIICRVYPRNENNVVIWASSNGNSWDVCNGYTPNISLPQDTDLWFRVSWDGTTYNFGYSFNGFDYMYGTPVANTRPVYWDNGIQNLGGCIWEDYSWYSGVIFPEYSSLSIDGSVVWKGITQPLQVGDSVTLNDGMAQSKYLWEAYDNSTELKGDFSKNSIIKSIEIDDEGNTLYEVDDFEVLKNSTVITTDVDTNITNYGGDPNVNVRYVIDVNGAEINSTTSVTQAESIIDNTYAILDVDFLTGYTTKLEVNGKLYAPEEMPIIAKRGSNVSYISTDTENNIRYYKTFNINNNTYLVKKSFTIQTNAQNPNITYIVNGNKVYSEDPIQCYHGDHIDYVIDCDGYKTHTGSYTLKYEDVNKIEYIELEPLYRLTINTTPENADVYLTVDNNTVNQKSIDVLENTQIKWSVELAGYKKQEGIYTINTSSHTIDVVLEPTTEYVAIEDKTNIANHGCDISDGFIVTSDGSNNYVDTETVFDFQHATTWEIETIFEYKYTQAQSNPCVFGNRTDSFSSPMLYAYSSYFRLVIPKSYNTLHIDANISSIQVKELRKYHFYVGQLEDHTYYVDYQYLDYDTTYGGYNENNWSAKSRVYTNTPSTTNKTTHCSKSLVFLGAHTQSYNARASLDLNNTFVRIDGEIVYSGVKSFSVNDFAYLNNGLGKTNNKWTAQHLLTTNKSDFTELGKVKQIEDFGSYVMLTLDPVKLDEVQTQLNIDTESDIITYGNLPNNITDIVTDIDSDIETSSNLDSIQDTTYVNHHIVSFDTLEDYDIHIEIGGLKYTPDTLPRVFYNDTLVSYNLLFNNRRVHSETFRLKQDTFKVKNTFSIINVQGATIKIYGVEQSSIECYIGQPIEFEVSKQGYKTCKAVYVPKLDKLSTYNTEHKLFIDLDEYIEYNITTIPTGATVLLKNTGYVQNGSSIYSLYGNMILNGDALIETGYINNNCTIEEVEDPLESKEYTTTVIIPEEATVEFKEI